MKNKQKELDIDIIGGQAPMTKAEELAISEFIKAEKEKRKMKYSGKKRLKTTKKDNQLV